MRSGLIIPAAVLAICAACTSAPKKLEQQAFDYGFRKIRLQGAGFEHIAFDNVGTPNKHVLHVYLEGDGSPWMNRRRIAYDPTPRNPLMLRLMALDSAPALYLGRPCYLGLADSKSCNPLLWTHRRYSREVIDSMARALHNYLATHDYNRLVFAGHSGGGTLAILLAARFPRTVAVVTLAGNLDIDQWTEYHHFSTLEGSQNPAGEPPLPKSVKEFHFVGREDENILPEFVLPRKYSRPNIEVTVVENFDHRCCWERIWPSILQRIAEF